MSNIIGTLPFYLNQPVGATDTSIQVKGLKNTRGVAITAMPSGVALIHVTIEPKSPTNQEIISFTGITDNGNGVVTLTGVTRNLNPVSPFTALTADVPHANNSTCVISNNPQVFQDVVMTNEARTVSAVVTFGASPIVPTGVNPTEAVNKSQLDAMVAGTVPSSSTTVLGAVRVATDPTKTLGTTTMTIANPCVVTLNAHGLTANDTIRFTTTGALPTGLVVGTTYYVIATGLTVNAFQLSTTFGGTAIITTGSQSGTHTLYRTTPYAINDQDTRLPTQGENDALAGTSGTPSSSNKFVTDQDSRLNTVALSTTFPLGESFTGATTPQPAALINDIVQPIFDGVTSFGAAASPQIACKIIPRQNVTVASLVASLYRTTDPATNLSVEIQTDNAGVPSNTPVTNGTSTTIATSTMTSGEYRYFNFTFSTPPSLVAGTTYHVVFKTSATNANQINIPTLTNASKYASFSGATYNGATWTANAVCPSFELVSSTVGSYSLWVSDGNGVEPINTHHGICTITGSAGAVGTIITNGNVSGFTGLSIGADYFLSNTAGTITLNQNEGVYIGKAISSTTINLQVKKIGKRNSRLSTILTLQSIPFLAYEDGTVNIMISNGNVSNGTNFGTAHVTNTYANATNPVSVGGIVAQGGNGNTGGNTTAHVNLTVPLRKGERIQFTGTTSPSISYLFFTPII